MLTKNMQLMMIRIFANHKATAKELSDIYSSHNSLYRASKYLIESGFMIKTKSTSNLNTYSLSNIGVMLVKNYLLRLPEVRNHGY